jgi:hypothetical protein
METAVMTAETAAIAEVAEATIDKESGELIAVCRISPVAPVSPVVPAVKEYGKFDGEIDVGGIRRLLAGENGVIRMAVDDAIALTQAGVIVKGHLAVEKMPRAVCDAMTIPEVKELLQFFKDENIGLLLTIGGIDLPPRRFRQKLGFDW